MRIHSTIALAAMAVALASPQAVMAKTRQADGLTNQEQLQMAQQQIAQLQAQLNSLQSKIDQQAATQSQAAADAQAASAKADKALAQASAASEKASKPAALPKSVEWAADTKISGRMYFNASTATQKAGGVTNEKDGGFQIKRFYVGVDHKFDDTFSGNVTMDIDNVANTSGKNVGKGFYVKKAYLQAKFDPALTVRLGAADTPWIPYAEGIYGYRHLEKTITDLDSFGTSADWGVHVLGDLADGLISYQVSAVDGAGYRDPKFTKTIDLEGRLSLQYKGFNAAIGGYTGKLGKDVGTSPVTYHTANRFNALLAYKGKVQDIPFTLGGEYFYAKNWSRVDQITEDSSDGYSIFASVSPVKQWSLFGRYDWVKPSKDLNPTRKNQYFNVGVQYSPAKIVDLALVYKRYDGDNLASGGIGDLTVGGAGKATRDEIGLFGQFRF